MSYNTQVQRVMDKSGLNWFKFDEASGNATDSKGVNVGTVYSGVTRVDGWNGEGHAMRFNRNSTSYIRMNAKIIPTGSYTIRFKMKLITKPTAENQEIISNAYARTTDAGLRIWSDTAGNVVFTATMKGSSYDFYLSMPGLYDSKWYDYMFAWDTVNMNVYLYVDEVLVASGKSLSRNTLTPTFNLVIGKQPDSDYARYFYGEIDEFQVYNQVLTPEDFWINGSFIYHNGEYKIYDSSWQTVSTTLPTLTQFQSDSMDHLNTLFERVDGYRPLDDISGDFDIVTWTDDDGASRALEISVKQFPQLVYAKNDIALFGVEYIDNITLTASGDTKVAVSFDGGVVWNSYKNNTWEVVENAHYGMTVSELNSLASLQLEEVRQGSNFIRFSYSLTGDAEVDKIRMLISLVGKEKMANTSDYDVNYNTDTNEITYNFKKSGTYTIHYIDGK